MLFQPRHKTGGDYTTVAFIATFPVNDLTTCN